VCKAWRESAVSLPTALRQLEQWLAEKGLLPDDAGGGDEDGRGDSSERATQGSSARFAFVTCGDWDLKNALPRNCDLLGVPVPRFMLEWSNIKAVYHKFYNTRRPPAGAHLTVAATAAARLSAC
jgi:inhibitor of KinA sporulation pathway (predicted exonuclease)